MGRSRLLRRMLAWIAVVIAVLGAWSANASAAPLSISVSGNHFVNGDGQTVRLLGANHPSFEYACEYGYAYNDGHMDDADAAALASWHVTAVRVPLNEDCWLGINGRPSNSQNPDPPLTQAGYQQAVEQYVAALNAHGLYAILDLHWTAPGTYTADGQRPMPDSHSVNFWDSVATTFKANPAVVFDIFNEPYSPAAVNDPAHPVDWNCWRDGGCALPVSNDQSPPDSHVYQAVGMQTLVSAIRATGATQPVLVGGLDYANDLTQWADHAPDDPLNQEAASFHNYQGKPCDNAACWDSTIAAVAANVPVVTGEFDQDVCAPSTFDTDYMNWADQHGVGYLAWGWWVLSQQEITDAGCSAFYLLTNYDGTPAAPNGTALHDHLAALAAAGGLGAPGGPGGGPGAGGGGVPRCHGKRATIVGTARGDKLKGTKRADVIVTLGGNDTVRAGGGNDTICTGRGNDRILGGTGNDLEDGGSGKDRLYGQGGKDHLNGGPGKDTLNGGGGADKLAGGSGKDKCTGGAGHDHARCEVKSGL